ncbi:hypothetical protein J4E81_010892 [Alternaria sp. BMP 2799]|nr:hypothetical protein J4E81_010892 [Alternaria sp. BMP 2799]
MRLTTSVIAGFIAFGAATPAGLAVKPSSIEDPVDAVPAQHTPVVDGNWHIGCDKNNYCSYYQGDDVAVGNTNSVSPRTIALSEASCKQCSTEDPCDYCTSYSFDCRDCDHYQCYDAFLKSRGCFDIQPELADVIRNHTVTATILETTISTSVVTVTAMPTSETSISDITTTVTLARTALPPTHTGLAPRDELASNDGDNQSPTRRTAFKQSECFPCNDQTCPQPGTTSTVTYHYQDPASTIMLQPPTVTASRSPHVLEIPVTVITTATHTVARSVRANQTPAPMSPRDSIIAKPMCDSCDGNPECDGCDFACDEDQGCEHFLCKDPLSEAEICISLLEDAEASKAYDTSMASGDFLGSAAMLLVLAGDDAPTSNTTTTHLQPAISNGTRPDFSFADEDCYLCESGDESCNMCDWQFTCGIKKKCFHNGAREVVELCFEKGEKCRP